MRTSEGDFYVELGTLIRAQRHTLTMTQAKLAQILDIPRSSVTMIEQGRQAVHVRQLLQIANALRVHYTHLVPAFASAKAPVDDSERAWLEAITEEK
jgi:transcriptional regulator with XRE-family HTH domain